MTKKSFIKTIGEKGLLADYNTEGKKLQTELTFDTTPTSGSTNPVTSDGIKTAINAKADGNNSVAIFDGYMRRMNESTGWRKLAYKQFNYTNTNLNALFRLYLFGSNNEHIGLGDLIVNIRFNSSGSAPELKTCYLMDHKPLHTLVKVKVIGVAGNAVVELWFRPPTFSMLTLTCLGNGLDVISITKDWTFGRYLDSTDPEPVEDIANNVYVFSRTVKRLQLDIDNPTNNNLVAMDANGLVKDSGISLTSSDIANWNSKQNRLTFDDVPKAGSTNPVTSDGIKKAIEDKASQFSLGSTKSERVYTMFARMSDTNHNLNGEAQVILSSAGNYASTNQGTWEIIISNRGSTASSPKASMTVRCINAVKELSWVATAPTFGYYIDTTNHYIYFGIYSPPYRGQSRITVLANNSVTLQDFGDSTTAPTGWTTVTPTGVSSAETADKAVADNNGNNIVNTYATKTELDSRVPAPTSTTGTQVLKCINGVIQWVTE